MTLNNILNSTTDLTYAEKHTLRTLLQDLLNYVLESSVCRQIADRLYHAMNIAYSLYERFTTVLYNNIINKSK